MSYNYKEERPKIFTEEGINMILKIRDNIRKHDNEAGAFTFTGATRGVTGDSWLQLAVMDYLIEIGEIEKVFDRGFSQFHIYRVVSVRYDR